MYKHILVATDGSDHARKAIDAAADLSASTGAELTVLHVLMHGRPAEELARMAEVEHMVPHLARTTGLAPENVPGTMGALVRYETGAPELARLVTAIGDKIVEDGARVARERGAGNVGTRVENGDYAETIADAADQAGADLIVIGHRGLGGVGRLLLGSVSSKVSQIAECSVLIVK